MQYDLLTTVVLSKNLPEYKLKAGDVGAVVECYGESGEEVEFVTGAGRTLALVTLQNNAVREIGESDVLSVRRSDSASVA